MTVSPESEVSSTYPLKFLELAIFSSWKQSYLYPETMAVSLTAVEAELAALKHSVTLLEALLLQVQMPCGPFLVVI